MNSTTVGWSLAAMLALLAASSATAQTKEQIQKLDDAFGAAVRAGDAARLGQLYAEDATLMPSGGPRTDGRAAIESFWGGGMKTIAGATLTASDVAPLGHDYARELGVYALTTKGSPSQTIAGKYVVIWKRVGGGWKLWTDIWNSDRP
jgi:uncharacterized protein (TIGR02246 family)